mmetsp:Transcript_23529/g.75350  ORF Transcript_23529/g.75350 Transcript_23529/m.75350 type:complete len:230 (+) Transcript_23529:61-750(+)
MQATPAPLIAPKMFSLHTVCTICRPARPVRSPRIANRHISSLSTIPVRQSTRDRRRPGRRSARLPALAAPFGVRASAWCATERVSTAAQPFCGRALRLRQCQIKGPKRSRRAGCRACAGSHAGRQRSRLAATLTPVITLLCVQVMPQLLPMARLHADVVDEILKAAGIDRHQVLVVVVALLLEGAFVLREFELLEHLTHFGPTVVSIVACRRHRWRLRRRRRRLLRRTS